MLLFVQLLKVDEGVLVLRIEAQHLVERLERAIDESAPLVVEAQAEQHVRVLQPRELRALQQAWCTVIALPTWPFSRYRLPRIMCTSSASVSRLAARPSSSIARSIWLATRKFSPRM